MIILGDVVGNILENLQDLIRKPVGCGEQNLVNFAPDVFVMLYLEKMQRLIPELKNKAYKHFISGFQNQLK